VNAGIQSLRHIKSYHHMFKHIYFFQCFTVVALQRCNARNILTLDYWGQCRWNNFNFAVSIGAISDFGEEKAWKEMRLKQFVRVVAEEN